MMKVNSITNKLMALGLAALVAMPLALTVAPAHPAQDTSGHYAFFNDDRSQFVDFWLNDGGAVTIKVNNGRPWRPMAVVVHATFKSGDKVVGTRDFHVYCEAPNAGGSGKERWFTFAPLGFAGVTSVSITTNKEAPKERRPHDWRPPLPANAL